MPSSIKPSKKHKKGDKLDATRMSEEAKEMLHKEMDEYYKLDFEDIVSSMTCVWLVDVIG